MSFQYSFHKHRNVTQEYRQDPIFDRVQELQKVAHIADKAAADARDEEDWPSCIYHAFNFGRVCQELHGLKNTYNLDITIPEPLSPDEYPTDENPVIVTG